MRVNRRALTGAEARVENAHLVVLEQPRVMVRGSGHGVERVGHHLDVSHRAPR